VRNGSSLTASPPAPSGSREARARRPRRSARKRSTGRRSTGGQIHEPDPRGQLDQPVGTEVRKQCRRHLVVDRRRRLTHRLGVLHNPPLQRGEHRRASPPRHLARLLHHKAPVVRHEVVQVQARPAPDLGGRGHHCERRQVGLDAVPLLGPGTSPHQVLEDRGVVPHHRDIVRDAADLLADRHLQKASLHTAQLGLRMRMVWVIVRPLSSAWSTSRRRPNRCCDREVVGRVADAERRDSTAADEGGPCAEILGCRAPRRTEWSRLDDLTGRPTVCGAAGAAEASMNAFVVITASGSASGTATLAQVDVTRVVKQSVGNFNLRCISTTPQTRH